MPNTSADTKACTYTVFSLTTKTSYLLAIAMWQPALMARHETAKATKLEAAVDAIHRFRHYLARFGWHLFFCFSFEGRTY